MISSILYRLSHVRNYHGLIVLVSLVDLRLLTLHHLHVAMSTGADCHQSLDASNIPAKSKCSLCWCLCWLRVTPWDTTEIYSSMSAKNNLVQARIVHPQHILQTNSGKWFSITTAIKFIAGTYGKTYLLAKADFFLASWVVDSVTMRRSTGTILVSYVKFNTAIAHLQ